MKFQFGQGHATQLKRLKATDFIGEGFARPEGIDDRSLDSERDVFGCDAVGEDVDSRLKAGGLQFRDAGDLRGFARLVVVSEGASAATFADVENLGVAGINVGVDVVSSATG